jgi:hypothetical protein
MLVTEQYGFRKGLPPEDVAFSVRDSEFKSVNQKILVGRIFFDFAKAFNCVNH